MDEKEPKMSIEVKFFGPYRMLLNGVAVETARKRPNNFEPLLFLLLLNQKNGISRRVLIHNLFEEEFNPNYASDFRVTMHRLRKALRTCGIPCPEGEDYIIADGDIYRWNPKIRVDVDVLHFREDAETALNEKDPDRRLEKSLEAISLYKGDFLPYLNDEIWVIEEQTQLFNTLRNLLETAYKILFARKEYQRIYEIVRKIAALHPYDEFEVYSINCLIAMKRYGEAYQIYKDTVAKLKSELGTEPSEKLRDSGKKLNDYLTEIEVSTENMRETMDETPANSNGKGAYLSTFSGFVETYRFLRRLLNRTGQTGYVVIASLPEQTEDIYVKLLENAIAGSLREGDMFAKFNAFTFTILMMYTDDVGCDKATGRIAENFRTEQEKTPFRGKVNFQKFPISDMKPENGISVGGSVRGDNTVCVCVNSCEHGEIRGEMYNRFSKVAIPYSGYLDLIGRLTEFCDLIGVPHSDTKIRSVREGKGSRQVYRLNSKMPSRSMKELNEVRGSMLTLDIRVSHRYRSTMQGYILELDTGETAVFKSELEMIDCIDSFFSHRK